MVVLSIFLATSQSLLVNELMKYFLCVNLKHSSNSICYDLSIFWVLQYYSALYLNASIIKS